MTTAQDGPILVWGAGAIGGTLGAAFLRTGQDVVFVDSATDHIAAIRRDGLKIEGPIWTDTVRAPAFQPSELDGTFRRGFLCVKALHTRSAIAAMAPHIAADGFVVSAQNGLNEIEIAEAVGRERTVGCFVNFGADYLSPGVVHYSGRGSVVVGEIDGSETPRLEEIHALLSQFEPNAIATVNIWGFLWGKLIYGALLFATALTDDSIADVLDNPAARPVLARLGQEVGTVAAAQDIRTEGFDGFSPDAFRPGAASAALDRSFDEMVAHNRRSAKSHSGIWRDLAIRKRKTEADAQLGAITAAGARIGVPTPLTSRLTSMIHEIEEGRRELARENLNELAEPEGAGA
ncbi:ketopantoate reductase family protein [Pseudoruegeria sp. HB172150]|uniref:ketopantoate reductase family protein n=1 Tax=Pseudoruegeria sp. HB172150 TaxID=2721164 RepID=UPI0015556D7E|nr:2-dehydropantoate 2-reductase [Pseudoruegeria sp. HB172150]